MTRKIALGFILSSVCAVGLAAQTRQTTRPTTPQTSQQSKPAATDKVTFDGCVVSGAPAGATAQYTLNRLDYKSSGSAFDAWTRAHASTSGATGATTGASRRAQELQLAIASGSTVDLSQYAGQRVEVVGTLVPQMPDTTAGAGATASSGAGTTSGAAGRTGVGAAGSRSTMTAETWPRVEVTSVKKVAGTCTGL